MQRVIDAARQGMTPDTADTERTKRMLLAATAGLAVGVGTGTAAASAAAANAAAANTGAAAGAAAAGAGAATASKATGLFAAISSLSLGTKIVTAVVVSASMGGAGVWVTRAAAPASAPAISVTAPALAPPVMEPTAAPRVAPVAEPVPAEVAPQQPVAPRAAVPTVAKPSAPDPLAAELALIERARQGLKSGQPNQALAALAEHRAKFEHGVMTQERTALRALALCSLGDAQGKVEAERFLERNPGSPLATHLRTGCK
jgi:hypothetical protein